MKLVLYSRSVRDGSGRKLEAFTPFAGIAVQHVGLAAYDPLQVPPPSAESRPPATLQPDATAERLLIALNDFSNATPDIQVATLEARRNPEQSQTDGNVLLYALFLGVPGHPASDPHQANRLLIRLLSDPAVLQSQERVFAAVMAREFAARAALLEELSKSLTESEQESRAIQAEARERVQALSNENARLRRERDAAQRKLEAIAEIERSMIEREPESEPETEPEPVRPEQP